MERYKLINELQNKYKFKWGTDTRNLEKINWDDYEALRKAINPLSLFKNNRGTNDKNLGYEDLPSLKEMPLQDRLKYILALREISQFWGTLEGGGIYQQALAVPELSNRFRVSFGVPAQYNKLDEGRIFRGRSDLGTVKNNIKQVKNSNTGEYEYSMNALGQGFRKKNIPYFSVSPIYDGGFSTTTTHAIDPWLRIWGYKKGGKIK